MDMRTIVKDRDAVLRDLRRPIRSGRRLMEWRRAIGITRPVFAVLSACSERTVATQEAKRRILLPQERRLNEARRLLLGLCEIMDPDNVAGWLHAPNDWLAGQTPMRVIRRGEMDSIWELIHHTKTGGYL